MTIKSLRLQDGRMAVFLRRYTSRLFQQASVARVLLPLASSSAMTTPPKNNKSFSSSPTHSRDRQATTSSSFDSSAPHSRLSLISRHLQHPGTLQLNTPYSTERQSVPEKDFDAPPAPEQKQESPDLPAKMSNQETHPTVLIPGPIEYDDEVLKSMSHFRSVIPEHSLASPGLTMTLVNPMSACPS